MRYFKNILIAIAATLTVSSCVSEVDDVFDKSSTERINEAMNADKAVLVGQQNGWLLKMYGDLEFGGYNVLLKFTNDDMVTIATEVNYTPSSDVYPYEAITSHYKLEQSSGVVLSFDEYNKNIHYFSDPANPDKIGTNGNGFLGDLEFRVLQASADSVVLLGKKHGNHLVMVPAPVGESEWQSYFDQVQNVEEEMFYSNYKVNVGGKQFPATSSYRCLTVTVPTDEGNEYIDIPYTVTPEGYSFYEPVTIEGKTLTGFKYAANSMTFQELSNNDAALEAIVPPINQQFVSSVWYTTLADIGEFGYPYWDAINQQIMGPVLGEVLQLFSFGKPYPSLGNSYGDYFGASFISSGYGGALGFDYQLIDDDKIALAYNPNKNKGDGTWYVNNGYFHYLIVPFGANTSAEPVARVFTITTNDMKKPLWVKLTEVDNPSNVIKLWGTVLTYPFYPYEN